MVLIYGAAFSGKRDIARRFYHIESFCDGSAVPFSEIMSATAVANYHDLIRRLLDAEESPQSFTNRLISEKPDTVILMNDVGSGIVPIDRQERLWREECGICSRIIAQNAHTVIRVVCGIPQVLKGELPCLCT